MMRLAFPSGTCLPAPPADERAGSSREPFPIAVVMRATLTADQRATLKTSLEHRREQLQRQLADHLHGLSLSERQHDVAQQDADDAPQRRPEREIAMALSDHERRELDAVGTALQRLEGGGYGRCDDCDAPIPLARLQAEPWALRCIACETRREQRPAR
jgi:RNA polymerase-binding protein DksA